MKHHKLAQSSALFAMILSLTSFSAGAANVVTGPSDVSRIGGESTKTFNTQKPQPKLSVTGNAPFTAPKGAEKIMFVLKGVTFEGASAYTPTQLQALYADKIGKKISLADVYALAANLTAKYRSEGYILTQVVVPPQTISEGNIRLQIVEGQLDQIRIEGSGAQGSNADIIKLYVAELKSKGSLNNKNLEKTLLLINDLPGVTARSVLSPSKSKSGASDLSINVERKKMDGTVAVNNNGSRFLGRWQMQGGFGLNSLFNHNERIEGQFAYAPSGQGVDYELGYGEMRGSLPVGRFGTKIEANAGISNTQPGHTLEQFDVFGKSRFGGVKVTQPWIRSRELNVSTSAGLDVKSSKTTSNIDIARQDNITALRVASHADFVDTLFSAAVTSANLEVARGVSWFGASNKGNTDLSRPAGDPHFTKMTADVTRLERLANSLALQATIKGQLSNGAQLSSEEFGVGGANAIGRGYDPSELVGDDGLAGSLELQWTTPYQVSWLNTYTTYAFYDVGRVWNDDATSPSLREQSLASIGLGIRTDITEATHAGFMVAKPLTRNVSSEGNDSSRMYLNVSHDF